MSASRTQPESPHDGALAQRIVDRVVPRLIESLDYAGCAGGAAACREAKRLVLNLLVFVAASANGQVRAATARDGARLLQRILHNKQESAGKPRIEALRCFLDQCAAAGWRTLAPTLASARGRPNRKAPRCPKAALSDERLIAALQVLLGARQHGGLGKSVNAVLQRGIPGFSVRVLGNVHESLLARRWTVRNGHARLSTNKSSRRRSGAFYTPEPLVHRLVAKTLGPVLTRRLRSRRSKADGARQSPAAVEDSLLIVDPAMGCGHFLTAAGDYLAGRVVAHAKRTGSTPGEIAELLFGNRSRRRPQRVFGETSAVWRGLLAHAIRGYDTDCDSVELARLSLWLISKLPGRGVTCLSKNLQVRDPLLMPEASRGKPLKFDVVVGNPPYGTPADAAYRGQLSRALPLMRSSGDLAAAFLERSLGLAKAHGQVGLVLPKPLTYSFAWRHVRAAVRGRVVWMCDVGRGWDDVLLEQVLAVFDSAERPGDTYRAALLDDGRSASLPAVSRHLCERFDVLLSGLSRAACERLRSMRFASVTVGDLCKTFRGLPWQRRVTAAGDLPVFGGRDLRRWGVRSSSGSVIGTERDSDLARFLQPKLLFQNIIAHIECPQPHIRLIGTVDEDRRVTLDTVNNLIARCTEVDLKAVLALLHSEPVNWLLYNVIYNRAIRTMHFDQYFLDKIPLPPGWQALQPRLSALAQQCLDLSASAGDERPNVRQTVQLRQAEHQIDRLVARAYGRVD